MDHDHEWWYFSMSGTGVAFLGPMWVMWTQAMRRTWAWSVIFHSGSVRRSMRAVVDDFGDLVLV